MPKPNKSPGQGNPHQPHGRPVKERVIKVASDLAVQGMMARMFDKFDSEQAAKYCLDVAKRITDYEAIDGDIDVDDADRV